MEKSKNKIYALIPARGGSKRLKNKNIYNLNDKPLIQYTIEAALKSKFLNETNIYVFTEDEQIKLKVNRLCKIIDRPKHLAEDNIWTQDVINHFSDKMNLNENDIIVVLQANSPEMTTDVIDACIELFLKNDLWQVHTVNMDNINNGAIQVMYEFVSRHKGKVNYNGVVYTDWTDVHTIEDIEEVIQKMFKNENH